MQCGCSSAETELPWTAKLVTHIGACNPCNSFPTQGRHLGLALVSSLCRERYRGASRIAVIAGQALTVRHVRR